MGGLTFLLGFVSSHRKSATERVNLKMSMGVVCVHVLSACLRKEGRERKRELLVSLR